MDNVDECRPYLEHLRDEHRELQQFVREVQRCFVKHVSATSQDGVAELLERLRSLRGTLEHHFTEEETGGCTEEAVSRRPALSAEAQHLERQHPALLVKLDKLIERVRTATESGGWDASYETAFTVFAKEILAHEARENRLLQLGFNVNMDLVE